MLMTRVPSEDKNKVTRRKRSYRTGSRQASFKDQVGHYLSPPGGVVGGTCRIMGLSCGYKQK